MRIPRILIAAAFLSACSTVATQEPVQLVYSNDAGDPWNRLFSAMFTRTVVHRKTSEFADAGPATRLGEDDFRLFPVSTRTFERLEDGDRAILPFYPSKDFLYGGKPQPLVDPRLEPFGRALSEALADRRSRTPMERVLMQADLWAVFDRLGAGDPLAAQVARLIAKLALTRDEIGALPDHYETARRTLDLPDLFSAQSPWQEIVWFDSRSHDRDARFRQATRVFVRTDAGGADRRALLNQLTLLAAHHPPLPPDSFERGLQALQRVTGATLVMQMLTIDRDGEAVPTPLVYTVQTRMFAPGPDGTPRTVAAEHELSRRLMRSGSGKASFRTFTGTAPAYLPSAGNDYGFASPTLSPVREPILGTVATRCTSCHGAGPHLFTFSVHALEEKPIRLLGQRNDDRAQYAIAQKKTREDYKRLRALFLETRRQD